MHMELSDVEMQGSLKQSSAPVLFGKRAPAVLTEHPTRYQTAAFYLFLYQTRTVWHKDSESRPEPHPH